jgi:hypothetical protein
MTNAEGEGKEQTVVDVHSNRATLERGWPQGTTGKSVWAAFIVTVSVLSGAFAYCIVSKVSPALVVLIACGFIGTMWTIFYRFKSYILGRSVFDGQFVFGALEETSAARASVLMNEIRASCLKKVKDLGFKGKVRSNIFRPRDELSSDGCAYVLRIDPKLHSEDMKQAEVDSLRFVPGEGHTGVAFARCKVSKGTPEEHINPFQFGMLAENLTYIISFPLNNEKPVGVLNIDFLDEVPSSEAVKCVEEFVKDDTRFHELSDLLSRGAKTSVRILTGPV